jgi:hypothetical protein
VHVSLLEIAARMGITTAALESLVEGSVPSGVAQRLGTTSSSLQEFVDGGTSVGLATKLGMTTLTVQVLREEIGQPGAIGVLIGLCLASQTPEG